MIVTIAVFSLLLIGIFSAMSSTMNHYSRLSILNDAKNISNNLSDYVKNKLQYADSMTIYPAAGSSPGSAGTVPEYVLRIPPDGRLSYGAMSGSLKEAFSDGYYDRYSFAMKIEKSGSQRVDISVQVIYKGEMIHTNLNTLTLDNMALSASEVTEAPAGSGTDEYIVVTFPE